MMRPADDTGPANKPDNFTSPANKPEIDASQANKPEKSKGKAAAAAAALKVNTEIRELNGKLGRDLPQGTSAAGHYSAAAGDRFEGNTFTAPNGIYRVEGSDWLLTIADGKFVEAARATPPDFGGEDVVQIPNAG